MLLLRAAGLLDSACNGDFVKIVLLACFCAIHNHGFEVLFSFSAILQHTPCLPFGFSILKAGLKKSVLLSVYISKSGEIGLNSSSHGTISDSNSLTFTFAVSFVLELSTVYMKVFTYTV